jgi:hypothetical protein
VIGRHRLNRAKWSRARIIAGLSGFLTLIQSRDGPDRYGALSRLDTILSRPILAGVQEDHGAVLFGVLVDGDPGPHARQQPRHAVLALT